MHKPPLSTASAVTGRYAFAQALRLASCWPATVQGVALVAEGISDGDQCITVFLSSRSAAARIPCSIGRWRVITQGGA